MSNGALSGAAMIGNLTQSNHPTVPWAERRRDGCVMGRDNWCSLNLDELSLQFRNPSQVMVVVFGDEEDKIDYANLLVQTWMQGRARD